MEVYYYKNPAKDYFSLFIVKEVGKFLLKTIPKDALFVSISGRQNN